jgi:hypothetical protein
MLHKLLNYLEELTMEFKMTEMELKTIAQSEYVAYTLTRLDKEHDYLSSVIADPDANNAEIVNAATKREVIGLCIQLFFEVESLVPDFIGKTPCQLIEKDLGLSIDKLQKQTGGGLLAQDIMDKTSAAVKVTTQTTKKGINSFASWLVNKTK